MTPRTTERGRARRYLASRQPIRALTVICIYLLLLAAAAGPLSLFFGGRLGTLLMAGLALLLTVPVAVAAPRPRSQGSTDQDQPVLRRSTGDQT